MIEEFSLKNDPEQPSDPGLLVGVLIPSSQVCGCGPDKILLAYRADSKSVFLTVQDTHYQTHSSALMTINDLRDLMALCASMLEKIGPDQKKNMN